MTRPPPIRAFITGLGVVSPAGSGLEAQARALLESTAEQRPLAPLWLFEPGEAGPRPAGQVPRELALVGPSNWPRTHRLALAAAQQALEGADGPPDALVLGVTTGGMPESEALLMAGERNPVRYRLHGAGTVAEQVARAVGCRGPAFSVSTACSSAAVALKVALELIRSGRFQRVLAGGVDGLCRMTYFGFSLLKLVDPAGCRPLARDRAGLSVSEGAAMLLLQAAETPHPAVLAELLGGGLSCDAHHATAPHPEGLGALRAMRAALVDAGLPARRVDYVNLHGTGTPDNDAAEALAVRDLFDDRVPPVSSTKGVFGHPLAAAGALEAVVAVLALTRDFLPANTGLGELDPALGLEPVRQVRAAELHAVLSNSFGFGGNNAALVFGAVRSSAGEPILLSGPGARQKATPGPEARLRVVRRACLTGAGHLEETWARLARGESARGVLADEQVVRALPPRACRRLKRLPRMALALGQAVCPLGPDGLPEGGVAPRRIFFATGFGPLSETHDFLTELLRGPQRLASPIDFVGSVHNAPAAQLAIRLKAQGANLTASGGEASFEAALLMAELLAHDESRAELEARPHPLDALLLGADEHHPVFGPLFGAGSGPPADGGGGLWLRPEADGSLDELGPRVHLLLCRLGSARAAEVAQEAAEDAEAVLRALDVAERPGALRERYGALWLDLPAGERAGAEARLGALLARAPFDGPRVDLRAALGEFCSVSAVGAALAAEAVARGALPAGLLSGGRSAVPLEGRGVLLLGLGSTLTAVEFTP